jgi:hypothetical protein
MMAKPIILRVAVSAAVRSCGTRMRGLMDPGNLKRKRTRLTKGGCERYDIIVPKALARNRIASPKLTGEDRRQLMNVGGVFGKTGPAS